jgi:hypothetical protein
MVKDGKSNKNRLRVSRAVDVPLEGRIDWRMSNIA